MRIFARGFNKICDMKKVLFAFAAIIVLAACGNKQAAAPETEGFYESVGFKQSSDVFMLDGIPHIKMTWTKERYE